MALYPTIQYIRDCKEEKQKNIAEALNMTQQQYSLYETGKREMKMSQLKQLCEYYGVSADYILGLPRGLSWPR